MPKKKITPAEEPEQTAGLMEQAGGKATAPPGEPPQDMGAPDGSPPLEFGDSDDAMSGDAPDLTGDGEGDAPEVMAVDVSEFPPDGGLEGERPKPMPEGDPLMDAQKSGPTEGVPMEEDRKSTRLNSSHE